MIASELALELGIEPGTLSKRLKTYYKKLGVDKPRNLSDDVIEHMKTVHNLLNNDREKTVNTTTAIEMVLGQHREAIPPDSVKAIELHLSDLAESQLALHSKLDGLTAMFLEAMNREETVPVSASEQQLEKAAPDLTKAPGS